MEKFADFLSEHIPSRAGRLTATSRREFFTRELYFRIVVAVLVGCQPYQCELRQNSPRRAICFGFIYNVRFALLVGLLN